MRWRATPCRLDTSQLVTQSTRHNAKLCHKMLCKCDSNDTLVRKSIDTLVHANYTDSQLVTHLLKQNGQLVTWPWKHNGQLVTEKSVWRVDRVTSWLASCRFMYPLCRTPANIRIHFILPETRSPKLQENYMTAVIVWVYLYLFLRKCFRNPGKEVLDDR